MIGAMAKTQLGTLLHIFTALFVFNLLTSALDPSPEPSCL